MKIIKLPVNNYKDDIEYIEEPIEQSESRDVFIVYKMIKRMFIYLIVLEII